MSTSEACADTTPDLHTYTFAVGEHTLAVTLPPSTELEKTALVSLDGVQWPTPTGMRTLDPALRYALTKLLGTTLRQRRASAALERSGYGIVCRVHLGIEPTFDAIVLHLVCEDPRLPRDRFALLTWRGDLAEEYVLQVGLWRHLDDALLDLAGQASSFGATIQRADRSPHALAANLECSLAHARLTEESRRLHVARIEAEASPALATAIAEASAATVLRLPGR